MNVFITLENYKVASEDIQELVNVELVSYENKEYYEVWAIMEDGTENFYYIPKHQLDNELYGTGLSGEYYLTTY